MRITRRHLLALAAGTTAAAADRRRGGGKLGDAPGRTVSVLTTEKPPSSARGQAPLSGHSDLALAGEEAGLDRFFDAPHSSRCRETRLLSTRSTERRWSVTARLHLTGASDQVTVFDD